MKRNKFYKENNRWYIDLPEWINQGLPKEDLEMVLGADKLLDILSNNSDSTILTFSKEPFNEFKFILNKKIEDEYGSTYEVSDFYQLKEIWLCNVTKFVFGDFPEKIYFG